MGLFIVVGGGRRRYRSQSADGQFWFKNESNQPVTVSLAKSAADAPSVTLQKSGDGERWENWGTTSTTALTAEIPAGGKLYLKGNNAAFATALAYYNSFSFNGNVSVHGDMAALTGSATVSSVAMCFAYLFRDCTTLLSVDIVCDEYSNGMFRGCSLLEEIRIPSTSTAINTETFKNCVNLSNVSIPYGVASIGEFAFDGCHALGEIVLPASVATVGTYAFRSCISLTDITFGSSVQSFGNYVFSNCNALSKVYYNGTIAQWCGITFADNTANPLGKAHNLYIGGELLTELTTSDGITSIGAYAFYGCSLISVKLSSGVTSLGNNVFANCTNLVSARISGTSVTTLPTGAFYGCTSLSDVKLPLSLTSIGSSCFSGCTNLEEIYIPDTVTSIGGSAFYGSTLQSLPIPDGVTEIANGVASHCDKLIHVEIGSRVETIQPTAFNACTKLREFFCNTVTPPTVGNNAFDGIGEEAVLFVPSESVEAYKEDDSWSHAFYDITEM